MKVDDISPELKHYLTSIFYGAILSYGPILGSYWQNKVLTKRKKY